MSRSSSEQPASRRSPSASPSGDLAAARVSYLPPASLAAARDQVEQRVENFVSEADGDPAESEVIRIGSGPPAEELAKVAAAQAGCVVADFVLWHPKWDEQHCAKLSDLLRPGGRIVFLEPVATYGWRRRLHRRTQSRLRAKLGYDFEKDVPADLRRSGLTLTTVDRFDLGRTKSYAWGQAEHF